MTSVAGDFSAAPIPKLDPTSLADAFFETTRERLVLTGIAAGGEVGAAFVRRADGRPAVMSRGGDADALRAAGRALAIAVRTGLPVPRYQEVIDTAAGVVLLHDHLPGSAPARVTDALVIRLMRVTEQLEGILVGRADIPEVDLYLDRSGPGFCIHETLRDRDDRTRRLLGWVRETGRSAGMIDRSDDLVHLDLHPGNVLVDEAGEVTGIIDWDAAGRGDARLALVTLWFDLSNRRRGQLRYSDLTDHAVATLASSIERIDENQRRRFWAHMSLRQVDWSIRHHGADVVDHYLAVAEAGIDRFGLD